MSRKNTMLDFADMRGMPDGFFSALEVAAIGGLRSCFAVARAPGRRWRPVGFPPSSLR